MKNKSKQLILQQQNLNNYDSYQAEGQQHHTEQAPRQTYQKVGHKSKVGGLNQSMDAGINSYAGQLGGYPGGDGGPQGQLYIPGHDQYHQNYVSNTFDRPGGQQSNQGKTSHVRSGSQIVGGGQQLGHHHKGGKKQGAQHAYRQEGQEAAAQQQVAYQMAQAAHGELSAAQLAQLAQLQQTGQIDQSMYVHHQSSSDRAQQQKAKRKHNLSQNMPKNFEQSAKMLLPDNTVGLSMGVPGSHGPTNQAGVIQKLQQTFGGPNEMNQISSKRSYDHNNASDAKKAMRQTKQKPHNQSMFVAPQQNQFDSARYNSLSALNKSGNLANSQNIVLNQTAQSKDRFQNSQKMGKKTTKVQGNGIVLPAGAGMQGVPQLKSQLAKQGSLTHQNKTVQQLPISHSISTQQPVNSQSHQRMHSLQDSSSVAANMQRGFNSASNAAMQQQAQIMQIYQQQNSSNIVTTQSTSSMKNKYATSQSGNSRKVIPQIGQVMGHHKRQQHPQQLSRDKDSRQLVVESYPVSNYQTYSQNYNTGNQIQGIQPKKGGTDTSRVGRLASREHSSRRALVGADMNNVKVVPGDLNSSYNQASGPSQGLSIPQKKAKQMQTQKIKVSHAHNSSLHEASNQSSFNQTSTHGFFNDPNQLNHQKLDQNDRGSTKGNVSQGGSKHQKNASQYTPTLTQSMKHTIAGGGTEVAMNQVAHLQNLDGVMLQTKKSGPIPQQSHMRQASMQVGVDGSAHSKKMSIQHRKNKSVLNNQIRINPTLQQNGGNPQGSKLRASQEGTSGKHKLNQYFDNYTDHVQNNFYMQPALNGPKANLSATQNQHMLQGSNSSLGGGASLKHNLSQSTHRKNKTSVIGGQQKILGINSSSAFQHPSQLPASLIAAESQPSATMKKIIGGTISHSHKSLRSQSSSRKRVASMDSTKALEQAAKYNLPVGQHAYSKKSMQAVHSGHMTPDLSSYASAGAGGSKHQQKASKILGNQSKGQVRQHIKPQGNIVIQQQHSGGNPTGHQQALLKSSQGNRRHSSILKGEHQDKQMIYIGEDNNATSKQAVAKRFGGNQPNARQLGGLHQPQGGVQSPDLLQEQDSLGSVSSLRANNLSFQDGGTGGGSQKPKMRELRADNGPGAKQSNYNTDKKMPGGQYDRLMSENPSDDYNLQRDYAKAQKQTSLKPSLAGGKQHHQRQRSEDADIDVANISVPDQPVSGTKQAKGAKWGSQMHAPSRLELPEESDETMIQPLNQRGPLQIGDMELEGFESINITKEALELGKVPPEEVADLIAASDWTLTPNDKQLSPRTREMVTVSNLIRKSFATKGDAPKTTPEFYRAGKMLGRGAFGKVSMGMHKLSRKLVALKSINKEYMTDQKQKSKVMHEVGILLRLRHQSVVKLYETFETKRHMLLAMELCAGGDLLNYVRKRKKLDELSAKIIFKQIIEGLGYIHKKRILHRDIKLDNILLDGKGNVKIADFGVSKLVKPGDIMHEQSGTPAYIAPEILREEGYKGFKADIWSAGVVLYAMLCGTVPFKASNMKELHKMIIKGKYHLKEEVSDDAKKLMRAMLETDPGKRISITKILEHPWLDLPDDVPAIFNQEEKDIVKKEFIYNNPRLPNRSEKIDQKVEPWDCFTELNLDSINQTLRNESEKSVILAPFNSSISDFDETEFVGMEASLIIHRLFEDAAPLQDKKATVRFAARCRDQDRQYEINNNGELDNGVYHKFVYSSRDGGPELSSSIDDHKGSVNDLRPQSSRNNNKHSNELNQELRKRVREGKLHETEGTDDYGLEESIESNGGFNLPGGKNKPDEHRIQTLLNFGYPDDYLKYCLMENEACYCMATYYLLGEDQRY